MRSCITLLALVLCSTGFRLHAQDLLSIYATHPASTGARASGFGQAGLAMVDDGTAAWWNPANLSWLRRTELSASMIRGSSRVTASFEPDGRDTEETRSQTNLDHIGVAYPVPVYRGSLIWAVGYTRLNSFDREEGIRSGTVLDKLSDEGNSSVLYASLAGQVSRTFHAGLTLMYHMDKYESLFSRSEDASITIQEHDDLEMKGVGLRLGGCYSPDNPLRISAVIQPPLKLDVDWTRTLIAGENSPGLYGNSYSLRLPLELGLGASWRERFWQLGISWSWQDWSTAEYDDLPAGTEQTLNNDVIEDAYQGSHLLALGGECTVPGSDLMLRAGLWYRSLPFSDTRITRLTEDSSYSYWEYESESPHWGFGLGAGYLFDQVLAIELSFNWENMKLSYLDRTWEGETSYRITTGESRAVFRLGVHYRM